MVHRWAAAHAGGADDYPTKEAEAEGLAAADILSWFDEGVRVLTVAIEEAPEDQRAMVFLADAPRPRQFWARRQAHETTIHSLDALAAQLGRLPTTADTAIPPELAVDGIDELLTGFLPRKSSRLRSDEPFTLAVAPTDFTNRWTVHVTADHHPTTTLDEADCADAQLSGTAAELYMWLWNRTDEIAMTGRDDILNIWRSKVRVRWS